MNTTTTMQRESSYKKLSALGNKVKKKFSVTKKWFCR